MTTNHCFNSLQCFLWKKKNAQPERKKEREMLSKSFCVYVCFSYEGWLCVFCRLKNGMMRNGRPSFGLLELRDHTWWISRIILFHTESLLNTINSVALSQFTVAPWWHVTWRHICHTRLENERTKEQKTRWHWWGTHSHYMIRIVCALTNERIEWKRPTEKNQTHIYVYRTIKLKYTHRNQCMVLICCKKFGLETIIHTETNLRWFWSTGWTFIVNSAKTFFFFFWKHFVLSSECFVDL